MNILQALVDMGITKGYAEGRRLILENRIKVNDKLIKSIMVFISDNDVVSVVKRSN